MEASDLDRVESTELGANRYITSGEEKKNITSRELREKLEKRSSPQLQLLMSHWRKNECQMQLYIDANGIGPLSLRQVKHIL